MTSISNLIHPPSPASHVRPFDVRRDLKQVADLVETCFAETLDPDGERYLRQMRSAAQSTGFLRWASAAPEWASVPFSGYVWEEDGRLVGNLSLIPYKIFARRFYLIANVAVDPRYRRRGIARALTLQGMEHARKRGAYGVWLHVRENNPGAVHLYQSLGFTEQARRTTWYSQSGLPHYAPPEGIAIIPRRTQFWKAQAAWLRQTYPPELTWHLSINLSSLRAGFLGTAYRVVTGSYAWQRAALEGRKLLGVISWQGTHTYADNLWLAADPEREDLAARALLLHARQRFSFRRPLSLDYPAGRAVEAIQEAGFHAHQTLIWMNVPFISPQYPQ